MLRVRLRFSDDSDRDWAINSLLNAGYIVIAQKVGEESSHIYIDINDEDVIIPPDYGHKEESSDIIEQSVEDNDGE